MTSDSLSVVYTSKLEDLRASNEPDVVRAYELMNSISHLPRTLHLPSLPDGTIDRTISKWAFEPRAELTQQNYSHDVHQFFEYWYANYTDRSWITAKQSEISLFLGWYRYQSPIVNSPTTRKGRAPSTVSRMQAALNSIYDTAIAGNEILSNPVPRGTINATKGQRRSSANWLTPGAIEDWQKFGLNRVGDANQERILQNYRNVAYAKLIYGTGLRRQEAGGLITLEIPQNRFSNNLYQGWVPSALSKNSPYRGRAFYAERDLVLTLSNYCQQQRLIDIEAGKRSGKYEDDKHRLIVVGTEQIGGPNAAVTLVDVEGRKRKVKLQELTLGEREHIYETSESGFLEPLYLWLQTDGTPLKPTSWNGIFEAANKACARSLGPTAPRITPHRLRHSFALRVFAASLLATVNAGGQSNQVANQALLDQGNIWIRIQNLLGHKSPETTRDYYLEPVATLEWELIIRESNGSSIATLLSLISRLDSRIQNGGISDGT